MKRIKTYNLFNLSEKDNKHPSNVEIFKNGNYINDWPCDIGDDDEDESNASVENLYEYDGDFYFIITDHNDNLRITNPEKIDIKQEYEDDSFVWKLIKNYLIENEQCQERMIEKEGSKMIEFLLQKKVLSKSLQNKYQENIKSIQWGLIS